MRFAIHYRCEFSYPEPVLESHNVLRACPTSDARQTLLHYAVRTAPAARVYAYRDYWSTRVDAFGVRAPHASLAIDAEAAVETRATGAMAACPRRARLADPDFVQAHLEYLGRSPHTAWNETLREAAEQRAASAGDDVVGAVLALHRMVGTSLEYQTGSTQIGVDVNDVLRGRKGVCQDYAHLLIALARSIGVPARYVSGYLFAARDTDRSGPDSDSVSVKTHAWVEVAIPGAGWWGLDPTNRQEVGERHVKIGHGRDYDDVLPLRGVYQGPGEHALDVAVRIHRDPGAQQQ
jgi:transglutaminase-like putative cysteine protease